MAGGMTRSQALARWAMLAALAVFTAACDWPWQHDMADQPSRPADAGPRSPAAGTVPVHGTPALTAEDAELLLHNPIPQDAPFARGEKLYMVYCAPCHGRTGRGDGPVAQQFPPPVANLGDPTVQRHRDGWFYAVITNGTEHMPRSAYELAPAERWQIVQFIRRFGAGRP